MDNAKNDVKRRKKMIFRNDRIDHLPREQSKEIRSFLENRLLNKMIQLVELFDSIVLLNRIVDELRYLIRLTATKKPKKKKTSNNSNLNKEKEATDHIMKITLSLFEIALFQKDISSLHSGLNKDDEESSKKRKREMMIDLTAIKSGFNSITLVKSGNALFDLPIAK